IRIGNVVTETIRTFRGTTVPVVIEKLTRSRRGALRADKTDCWIDVRCCELTCTPACDRMLAVDSLVLPWVAGPVDWFWPAVVGWVWDLLSDEALLSGVLLPGEALVSDEP